jgi:hypothetical protein
MLDKGTLLIYAACSIKYTSGRCTLLIYIYIQSKCQSMKERKTISSLHTSELCWRHIPWGKSSWIESEEKLSRLVGEIFVNEQKGQYFIQPALIRYGKY